MSSYVRFRGEDSLLQTLAAWIFTTLASCKNLYAASSIIHELLAGRIGNMPPLLLVQVAELKKTARRLQEELNGVYKEKAKLAQEYVTSTNQLQIVRENFEQHDRMLTERANTIKELKSSKKDLAAQLDHLREANGEAVKELQVRHSSYLRF